MTARINANLLESARITTSSVPRISRRRCTSHSLLDSASVSKPAQTPQPPYYAVIFTSTRTDVDEGYDAMSDKMVEMAAQQPGFLGVESARGEDGLGITVSYWESEEAIANWRVNVEHRVAQTTGRTKWYDEFVTRVARVERTNRFKR